MKVSVLEELFLSEIIKWRYLKALLLTIAFQFIVITLISSAFSAVIFSDSWNPLMYFYLWCSESYQFITWQLLIPVFYYILFMRVHIHSFRTNLWLPSRRIEYISNIFEDKKYIKIILLAFIISGLLSHSVNMISSAYSTFVIEDKNSQKFFINPYAIFLWIFGISFGFRFAYGYFFSNLNLITFSQAEPSLFMLTMSKLQKSVLKEAINLLHIKINFVLTISVLYLITGRSIVETLTWLLTLPQKEISYIELVSPLFDLHFVTSLIVSLVVIAFNIQCFLLNFKEIVSQRIDLPISVDDTLYSQAISPWKLGNGLISNCDMLKLLAFKQLSQIGNENTAWAVCHRQTIYAISQPGGHPRNWQSISTPSLNLIRNFTQKLAQVNSGSKIATQQEGLNVNGSSGFVSDILKTDLNRNNVLGSKISTTPLSKLDSLKAKLKEIAFVSYMTCELDENRKRKLFADAQAVAWAVQGLSGLVCSSFTCDKFGVVQKNVAEIVAAIVHLQAALEASNRHFTLKRVSHDASNLLLRKKSAHDVQIKKSLKLTVRTCLYEISMTYGLSLREIEMEADVRKKLESYLNFQEA